MSKTVITPVSLPTTVGDYTAAQDVSGINSSMRVSFNKAALGTQGCAVFSCDDTTIASGSISGTFSASNSATWPNGGKGVRLLGSFVGGAFNLQGSPKTYLDVPEPIDIGPGLILLRTAGVTANTVEINGAGDTVFPSASITPVPLTLVERDASGVGFLVALTLGAVGATVSPSGDIRVTRAAQDIVSSVLVDGVTTNPLISLDGTDALLLNPVGAIRIGDDSTDRNINIGSGAGASKINLASGTSATSAWTVAATGTLSIASGTACTLNLGTGAGAKAINLGSGAAVNTINIGTGAAANVITIGTVTGAASLTLKAGSGGASLVSSGGFSLSPHGVGAGNTTELRFLELAAGGTNYTGFKAPDALAGNVVYVLPTADGSAGQQLTTNGAGVLSWT